MKNQRSSHGHPLRRVRALGLAALGLAVGFAPRASAQTAPAATVMAVQPTRIADLVVLDRGFNAGLREGMICRISRGPADVATVQLVELRPTCSAALILSVAPRQSIRAGDAARLQILKT